LQGRDPPTRLRSLADGEIFKPGAHFMPVFPTFREIFHLLLATFHAKLQQTAAVNISAACPCNSQL
jgi:hypothetical protein